MNITVSLQNSPRETAIPRLGQNSWDLETVLPADYQIPAAYFDSVSPEVIQNFRNLLSRDVYSEGDAQHLYDYILGRQQEMSSEFLAMLELWLQDECKHYEALRRTYHCLFQVSYVEMNQCFAARICRTQPIQRVLEDEFTMLVTLMFDEMGSVYSYRRDLQEYYQHFGPAIRKIGHHLVKDEGMHFNNAAEVLLHQHAHRLAEVPAFLAQVSALETRLKRYHKTFFLDHAQEQYRFPKQFNSVIIQVILARLGLGNHPPQVDLKQLWQWKPDGYRLVPIR